MTTSVAEPCFPFVAVDVEAGDVDDASAFLFECGASGVEERDATTLTKGEGGKVTLVANFTDPAEASRAKEELEDRWNARVGQIVGDAWRDDWKKHFHPFELFEGFVVRPPWEEYVGAAASAVIVLEPGRAFGTGLHETTSLVARALSGRARDLRGAAVLDVGCGSGILSIVALRLGAESARAIDVDPDAIAVTRENAAANDLGSRIDADTTPLEKITTTHAVVVANIEAGVLVDMAPSLVSRVAPGGVVVLSGVLAAEVIPDQVARVTNAYAALTLEETLRKGEWVALVLRAPSGR